MNAETLLAIQLTNLCFPLIHQFLQLLFVILSAHPGKAGDGQFFLHAGRQEFLAVRHLTTILAQRGASGVNHLRTVKHIDPQLDMTRLVVYRDLPTRCFLSETRTFLSYFMPS